MGRHMVLLPGFVRPFCCLAAVSFIYLVSSFSQQPPPGTLNRVMGDVFEGPGLWLHCDERVHLPRSARC